MSYQVIARKYRPQKFEEVVGQDHVTRTLKNAIDAERIAHAYLFVGPRGTGKTTIARIFSKCLNCEGGPKSTFSDDDPRCQEITEGRSLDVLEIDGASNRGIEEIRELRETVKYAPSSGKYKIYIIDEVHMLTKEAFNALLKTLEEPPAHVKFMFATTEPEKLPNTILSRCQRFDLRRIPGPLMAEHLSRIAELESVTIEPQAIQAILRGSEGCMRDAESILDQLISFCGNQITEQDALSVFGLTGEGDLDRLAESILNGDRRKLLLSLHLLTQQGKDLGKAFGDLILRLHEALTLQISGGAADLLENTSEISLERARHLAGMTTVEGLTRALDILTQRETGMARSSAPRVYLEISLFQALQAAHSVSLDEAFRVLRTWKTTGAPPPDFVQTQVPPSLSTAPVITEPSPSIAPKEREIQTSPEAPKAKDKEGDKQPAPITERESEPQQAKTAEDALDLGVDSDSGSKNQTEQKPKSDSKPKKKDSKTESGKKAAAKEKQPESPADEDDLPPWLDAADDADDADAGNPAPKDSEPDKEPETIASSGNDESQPEPEPEPEPEIVTESLFSLEPIDTPPARAKQSTPAVEDKKGLEIQPSMDLGLEPPASDSQLQDDHDTSTLAEEDQHNDLESLWAKLVNLASPLRRAAISVGRPISLKSGVLTVGFFNEDTHQLDLADDQAFKQDATKKMKAEGILEPKLKFVRINEDRPSDFKATPFTEAASHRSKAKSPSPKSDSSADKSEKSSNSSNGAADATPIQLDPEEFKNDPQIKTALELFSATMIDVKP